MNAPGSESAAASLPDSLARDLAVVLERPEWAREIAGAVSAYCERFALARGLPAEFLQALLARALRGAGEGRAAERFGAALPSPLDGLALTPELWRLLSRRVVRRIDLAAAGGPGWVIDFAAVRVEPGAFLELAFYQALRRLIEALASAWDSTGGCGWLALAGWTAPREQATGVTAAGAARYAQAVLGRLQARRGWVAPPRLLWLGRMGSGRRAQRATS